MRQPLVATPRRWSIRTRIVVTMFFVAIAPQLLVIGWSQLDRNVMGRLWTTVRDATEEVVAKAGASGPTDSDLEQIASKPFKRDG